MTINEIDHLDDLFNLRRRYRIELSPPLQIRSERIRVEDALRSIVRKLADDVSVVVYATHDATVIELIDLRVDLTDDPQSRLRLLASSLQLNNGISRVGTGNNVRKIKGYVQKLSNVLITGTADKKQIHTLTCSDFQIAGAEKVEETRFITSNGAATRYVVTGYCRSPSFRLQLVNRSRRFWAEVRLGAVSVGALKAELEQTFSMIELELAVATDREGGHEIEADALISALRCQRKNMASLV